MFGGFKSIERDFIQKLKERESLRKVASEDVMKPVEEVSAEDFLISSDADDTENVNSALDKKIEDMSNEADDSKPCVNCSPSKPCASCGQLEHSADCHENKADDDIDDPEFYSEVNDMMDTRVSFVLNGLGKIAADLRSKNERFAADMVEATAIKIKNEELEKVASKLYVFSELRKISSELLEAGDDFAADMVEVTMNKLEKKPGYKAASSYNPRNEYILALNNEYRNQIRDIKYNIKSLLGKDNESQYEIRNDLQVKYNLSLDNIYKFFSEFDHVLTQQLADLERKSDSYDFDTSDDENTEEVPDPNQGHEEWFYKS